MMSVVLIECLCCTVPYTLLYYTILYYYYTLLGAGSREKSFWRNYFFHCAFTRYEAGLSIDEIWSDQPSTPLSDLSAHLGGNDEEHAVEETITFESPASGVETPSAAAVSATPARTPLFDTKPTPTTVEKESATGGGTTSSNSSGGSNEGIDYEIVSGGGGDGDDDDGDSADLELDELEAEIARELED